MTTTVDRLVSSIKETVEDLLANKITYAEFGVRQQKLWNEVRQANLVAPVTKILDDESLKEMEKAMPCYGVQTMWQNEWTYVSDGQYVTYEEATEMAADIQRNGGQVRVVRIADE
jgi:hypothetical protein